MEGDFEPGRINGGEWVVDPLGFVAVKHLMGFVLFCFLSTDETCLKNHKQIA